MSNFAGGDGISVSNLSILITSAPKSASIIPARGPGPIPETSIILYPASGPIFIIQIFFLLTLLTF